MGRLRVSSHGLEGGSGLSDRDKDPNGAWEPAGEIATCVSIRNPG